MLPTPGFHHMHVNSTDPDTAIDWYVRQFPSTSKGEWAGHKALKSPNDVLVLFTKVATSPPTLPQSAIWHFGWHVADTQQTVAEFKKRPEVDLQPLYIEETGGDVFVSSDTWPNIGNTLGRTKAQIAEAKAQHIEPTRIGGFCYMKATEDTLIEIAGNHGQERFNHVHVAGRPFCAVQKHLRRRAGYDGTGHRGQLQGAAPPRPHLAGTEAGGDVPHPARRGRIRRRVADLVRQPGQRATGQPARPTAGPYRAQRRRPRWLGRQAEGRGRQVSAPALQAG